VLGFLAALGKTLQKQGKCKSRGKVPAGAERDASQIRANDWREPEAPDIPADILNC
jgi:hypothetical protein